MRNHPTIRRILAGLLLALFAFSGTPKKFLHDLVVHHKDTVSRFAHDTHTGVQSSYYSCHTEDLVVESPFIEEQPFKIPPTPVVYNGGFVELTARLYAFFPVRYSLRGPPAIV
ncbi:MAG TPA: hypothetical protein VHD83_07070 [Puia sp.]|nr:hypothetical protein [Puia sp.]